MKDEKQSKKSCTKRNAVYKTWCHTCLERDKEKMRQEGGEEGVGGDGRRVGVGVGSGPGLEPVLSGAAAQQKISAATRGKLKQLASAFSRLAGATC